MDISLENFIQTLEIISNVHEFDMEHSKRTSMIALEIGKRINDGMRLNADKLTLLHSAALIHDLGRAGIDDTIMTKKGKLTQAQRAAMRSHCEIGYHFLSRSGLPAEITLSVLYHHENWDGSGYPKGLSGLDIPLFPRIISIADRWDGIMSERPYHVARSKDEALQIMNKYIHHFDPKLYPIFLQVLKEAY